MLLVYPFLPCLFLLSVVTGNLFYAIAAMPDVDLRAAILHGLKLGLRNLWRLVGMSFAVAWQPVLLYLGGAMVILLSAMLFVGIAGIVVMAIALVALMIAVVLIYGPYIALASAGLAVEIYSKDGAEET